MRRISAPRIFKHWNRNLLGKTPPTPVLTSALLKQDGSFLLQQDGGKLLLNQN